MSIVTSMKMRGRKYEKRGKLMCDVREVKSFAQKRFRRSAAGMAKRIANIIDIAISAFDSRRKKP